MTIDEAIKHYEKVAEENDYSAELFRQKKEASRFLEKAEAEYAENECRKSASEHRQLAEWLRELKELREIFSKVDTGAIKPKDYLDLLDEWAKARKLLKAAVEDIYQEKCDTCTQEIDCKFCCCEGLYKWQHEAEALDLIGEDGDNSEN